MNCPVCGTLLPAQAKFCSQCGSPRAVPLGSVPLRPPRPPSAANPATKWLLAGAAVVLAAAAWLALKPGALPTGGNTGSAATPDAPTDENKAAALVGPQGVPGTSASPNTTTTTSATNTANANPQGTPAAAVPAPPAGTALPPAAGAAKAVTAPAAAVVAAPPPVRPAPATTAAAAAPPNALPPTVAAKPASIPTVQSPAVAAPPPAAPRPVPKEAPTLNDLLD